MLRNLVSLALLLTALPLFAGGIVVSPQTVTVRVGEVAVLHASNQPGGLSSGYPYSAEFNSDNPSVAEIHGFASGSGYLKPDPVPRNGDVFVTGLAVGTAHVRAKGFISSFATVVVEPGFAVSITPSALVVRHGETITLNAVTVNGDAATTEWYLGHTGDLTHFLSAERVLHFAPPAAASTVWLRAMTATGVVMTAEAEIYAAPRSRAVRH
jgi:hypothetical protein